MSVTTLLEKFNTYPFMFAPGMIMIPYKGKFLYTHSPSSRQYKEVYDENMRKFVYDSYIKEKFYTDENTNSYRKKLYNQKNLFPYQKYLW